MWTHPLRCCSQYCQTVQAQCVRGLRQHQVLPWICLRNLDKHNTYSYSPDDLTSSGKRKNHSLAGHPSPKDGRTPFALMSMNIQSHPKQDDKHQQTKNMRQIRIAYAEAWVVYLGVVYLGLSILGLSDAYRRGINSSELTGSGCEGWKRCCRIRPSLAFSNLFDTLQI